MKNRHLTVVVTGNPAPEDQGVCGRYEVVVDEYLTDSQAASCALDVFHSNVPVGVLDPLTFQVFDGKRELVPGDEDAYSLTSKGMMA